MSEKMSDDELNEFRDVIRGHRILDKKNTTIIESHGSERQNLSEPDWHFNHRQQLNDDEDDLPPGSEGELTEYQEFLSYFGGDQESESPDEDSLEEFADAVRNSR